MSSYSREPKEGVCRRGREQTELNPIREKTGGNDASKGWLWVTASPGTTPRLVQLMHHPFVSGLCPRAQASFAYWWRHFYQCSAKKAAMKWEQRCRREGRREEEIKRDKEKMGRKPTNPICTCKHCTQWMATHQLVERNRSLKTERKMDQLVDEWLIFVIQSGRKGRSDHYVK